MRDAAHDSQYPPTTSHPPRLLRAPAVAARLDVSVWRVYEMARQGVIPHVRLGRDIRFDSGALEEWIAAGGARANPTPQTPPDPAA